MDARAELLDRVVADVAEHGLTDRSLRDIAAAVGTSHRMLLYHFGSRQGLVAAIVQSVEAAQRQLLRQLAAETSDPSVLVMALWDRVSAPELRPFVRLFFESLAASAGSDAAGDLTSPWLDEAAVRVQHLRIDPAALVGQQKPHEVRGIGRRAHSGLQVAAHYRRPHLVVDPARVRGAGVHNIGCDAERCQLGRGGDHRRVAARRLARRDDRVAWLRRPHDVGCRRRAPR